MKKFQDTNKGTNDYEKIEDNQIVELQIDRLIHLKNNNHFLCMMIIKSKR